MYVLHDSTHLNAIVFNIDYVHIIKIRYVVILKCVYISISCVCVEKDTLVFFVIETIVLPLYAKFRLRMNSIFFSKNIKKKNPKTIGMQCEKFFIVRRFHDSAFRFSWFFSYSVRFKNRQYYRRFDVAYFFFVWLAVTGRRMRAND